MEGTPVPNLDVEERQTIRTVIAVVSTISILLSGFVVLTYIIFAKEKLRTSTPQLIFIQSVASLLFNGVFVISGYASPENLETNNTLCEFQAASILFLGNSMNLFWLAITISLFLKISMDKDEIHVLYYVVPILLSCTILTIIPFPLDGIGYDDVWCFIDSNNTKLLFGCFYGELIVCSIIGLVLWAAMIQKMMSSLRAERIKQSSNAESARLNSMSRVNSDTPINVDYSTKQTLMLRQLLFVSGFLVLFFVMLTNRLIIVVSNNPTFEGWIVHALAISFIGFWIFLVFGFTERNWQLWRELLFGDIRVRLVRNPPTKSSKKQSNAHYSSV